MALFKSIRGWGALVCGLMVLGSGCVKQRTRIMVKPDGSGNIVVSRVYTKQAVAMINQSIKQMATEFGDAATAPEAGNRFYNEKQIKREARQFGPHVTFVRAREVDQDGARGFAAVYAFQSINDVQVPYDLRRTMMSVSMTMSGDLADMQDMDSMENTPFGAMNDVAEFKFDAATKTLAVSLPAFVSEVRKVEPKAAEEKAKPESSPDAAEMEMGMVLGGPGMAGGSPEAMMEQMYSGMELALEITVQGALSETTASQPMDGQKGRFVLFDVNFDAMNKAMGRNLMESGEELFGGMDEANPLAALNGFPGVIMETNRTVRFVFK